MIYTYLETPIGPLLLAGEERLRKISFPGGNKAFPPEPGWRRDDEAFREARTQLTEYFAGKRRQFALDLDIRGTPFQRRVWEALRGIPYGQTCSYGTIAATIGAPNAMRAVGAANGSNPLPVVVPCHRVIGSNGKLTGFGGGLPTKQYLLDLEQGRVPLPLF
ncbi:MAG: methylated-DNA--[protein]-cysteine S-methyltransferase [Pseudomonadales bacterium]|nr:methylated-DNA--[protein]-cysteine S-methyltransferase [Pseudomonadales bacterium]MCP5184277.1 methylated-DNA--[protein]-cysteine S-methyltransferase [Pseudomonadales bacterium]